MNNSVFLTKVWIVFGISCLSSHVFASPQINCQNFVDQVNSEDYEWDESEIAKKLPQDGDRFQAVLVDRFPDCHILFIERNIERNPIKIRFVFFKREKGELRLKANGEFPLDDSVGSPVESSFIGASKYPFPNNASIIRLRATWSRSGGGFGIGSADSYYLWIDNNKLRPIFHMSDSGSSHYVAVGRDDCLDITQSKSQLKYIDKPKNSGWPNLFVGSTETEHMECGTNAKKHPGDIKPVHETQRKFVWTGKRYELATDFSNLTTGQSSGPKTAIPTTYEKLIPRSSKLKKQDAYLNAAYRYLTKGQMLGETPPPAGLEPFYRCGLSVEQARAFKIEQKRWLTARDKAAKQAGAFGSEPYIAALVKLTTERNIELKKRIESLPRADQRCKNYLPVD